MIDTHCHLEQKQYNQDRDKIIEACKKSLKAVVTSCANPKDFDLSLLISEKHKDFVFLSAGLHPEYIKEISQKEKDEYLEKIKENKNKIVAVGEIGLDYFWIHENELKEKQREQFKEMISFSKEIKKPLVIHSRNSNEDLVKILEDEDAKKVLLHMFNGKDLLNRVVENNWLVSISFLIKRSKDYRKVAKLLPLENIVLETDAPWNGIQILEKDFSEKFLKENLNILGNLPTTQLEEPLIMKIKDGWITLRNTPLAIKPAAEKIAEEKGLSFEEVWKKCGENAEKFLGLKRE